MVKTRSGKGDSASYTIGGINMVIKAGDCVLMRPSDNNTPPYVALVEEINQDYQNNTMVLVRRYYRPEESAVRRRLFHGAKELFLSDQYEVQRAQTIEGKCTVHSLKEYCKLDEVGVEDYFCQFEYKTATGAFMPDRVPVYCNCEMPYNPDDLMVKCEGCKDWYHPVCINMSIEQVKRLDHVLCSDCSSENDTSISQNEYCASPLTNAKDPVYKKRYMYQL